MTMPGRRLQLSPHFKLTEFRDWHADKLPPASIDRALAHLCQHVLEPLRAAFGPVTIHSGYRTRATNIEVGGAPDSYHVYTSRRTAPACDLTCARGNVQDWARWLDAHGVGGLGVYPTHVHVDERTVRARW